MEDIYQNPVVFKIHRGTPRSDVNLCPSCRHCHRMVEATGRERVLCTANRIINMTQPIVECSLYINRTQPTLSDMQEIAWSLMTDKGGRKLGFQSPEQRRRDESYGGKVGF